jgi:hypothetical protein
VYFTASAVFFIIGYLLSIILCLADSQMAGLKLLKLNHPSRDAKQQERWVRIFNNARKVLLILGHSETKDGLMFAQGDQKSGKSVAQLQQLRAGDTLKWRELVTALVTMTEDLGAEVSR